jgi:hypothetical protein
MGGGERGYGTRDMKSGRVPTGKSMVAAFTSAEASAVLRAARQFEAVGLEEPCKCRNDLAAKTKMAEICNLNESLY